MFLIFISIVNRQPQPAFAGCSIAEKEEEHASNEERRIEARICCHGSRQAARNREQGREGQSWWRTQEQLQPLIGFEFGISAGCVPFRPALFHTFRSGIATLPRGIR